MIPHIRFKIRPIKPGRLRALQKKAKTKKWTGRRRVEIPDEMKLHTSMLHEAVNDWRNISDGEEPMPCTAESREWLDDNWAEFSTLWQDIVISESQGAEEEEEEAQGN